MKTCNWNYVFEWVLYWETFSGTRARFLVWSATGTKSSGSGQDQQTAKQQTLNSDQLRLPFSSLSWEVLGN